MVIEESWGIPIERIRTFFLEQPDVISSEDVFFYEGCRILLTPAQGNIGPWTMPRTQIHMEGPEEPLKAIYRRFFLRFLSAGG